MSDLAPLYQVPSRLLTTHQFTSSMLTISRQRSRTPVSAAALRRSNRCVPTPSSVETRLTFDFQFMLGIGAFVASWVTFGTSAGLKGTQAEWRVPLGLQVRASPTPAHVRMADTTERIDSSGAAARRVYPSPAGIVSAIVVLRAVF